MSGFGLPGGGQDGMDEGFFVAKNQGPRLLHSSWVAKQVKIPRAGSSTTGAEGCREPQLSK